MTLFELIEKCQTLKAEMNSISDWIAEKAADPKTPMEEIEEKKKKRDEINARYELVKAERDKNEAAQREQLKKMVPMSGIVDEKAAKVKAKADFYRAALVGDNSDVAKAYQGLGGIPALDADLGNGSKLLPTNMSNELIVEPAVENPMREVVRVSNISGLEEPKLIFEFGDAFGNRTDKQTANEIKIEGDLVAYGRNKVKVKARVTDTVIHGSDLNLASEIENGLKSGLAENEMSRMFAENPTTEYAHMSFYSAVNGIKVVTGNTKQAAIAAALADLPIAFRRNAKIAMSAIDWFDMWKDNLNQSGTFYEERPLQLFGKKVVLVDDADDPIVGDFNYARINYDITTTYDVDKDVDAGMYKFVLTAWYDIKMRLKSAFRRAKVSKAAEPDPEG